MYFYIHFVIILTVIVLAAVHNDIIKIFKITWFAICDDFLLAFSCDFVQEIQPLISLSRLTMTANTLKTNRFAFSDNTQVLHLFGPVKKYIHCVLLFGTVPRLFVLFFEFIFVTVCHVYGKTCAHFIFDWLFYHFACVAGRRFLFGIINHPHNKSD